VGGGRRLPRSVQFMSYWSPWAAGPFAAAEDVLSLLPPLCYPAESTNMLKRSYSYYSAEDIILIISFVTTHIIYTCSVDHSMVRLYYNVIQYTLRIVQLDL